MGKKAKIKDIIPDLKNFNKGSEYGKSLIDKSFEKFGAGRSILIDKNNNVIAGNKSLESFSELGFENVEIVESDGKKLIAVKRTDIDLNTPEGREMALADNQTVKANIEWDFEVLGEEMDEYVLEEWGIDIPEEDPIVVEDNFNVPNEINTDIANGDLFVFKRGKLEHRLLCGDSTNANDFDKLMGDVKADMVFADPPYDLKDNYSVITISKCKDDCHIFIMNSDRKLIDNINNNINFFKKIFSIDFRQARLISNNQPMTRVDLVAEFNKGKGKFVNKFDGFSTLIECSKIHSNKIKMNFGHKQAKRVDLPGVFILHYSTEFEVILDPFLGSGSTMVACNQLKRNCYGMEIDEKNCQIIVDRVISSDPDLQVSRNNKSYKMLATNEI